jgi:uncharacterized protein YdiU (UPF0061 family)
MKHTLHAMSLSNSFAKLPETFYSRMQLTPFETSAELTHCSRLTQTQDYTEIERLFKLLQDPFTKQPGTARYAEPAPDQASGIQASCSS